MVIVRRESHNVPTVRWLRAQGVSVVRPIARAGGLEARKMVPSNTAPARPVFGWGRNFSLVN